MLNGDAEVRRRRLRDARAADESTLEMLFAALGDDDPGVRREAVRLVGRSPASTGLLLVLERSLTDDKELARRSSAMDALAALGKPALVLLSRLATDPRVGIRRLAVDALGMSRLPESVEVLERAVRDPQAAVRSAALEAIARSGSPKAPSILLRVADDRSEQPAVVLAALLGLLQLQRIPAAATLKRLAEDPLTAPAALRLLGRAGDVMTLVGALEKTAGSRQRAAVVGLADALDGGALGSMRPTDARPIPGLTSEAARAALRNLVENSDIQVACAALVVAGHGGDVDILAQAAARDDRAHLASAAHRAVAVLEPQMPDLVERLRQLAADDAPGADLLTELADAAARERAAPPEVPPRLDERAFARLARVLDQAAGIQVSDDARTRLEARLMPRLDAVRVVSFGAYVDLIGSSKPEAKDELQRALELVTVHETYFFRERGQLDAFRDDVVRPMISPWRALGGDKSDRDRVVRAWSAGTSTGEEAYTLAILLEEAGVPNYEVVGTDLSLGAIEKARAGRYTPKSFRGDIDPNVRKRWFIYELGAVQVHPDLKKRVHFEPLNLVDQQPPETGVFDVIFCRNVLIYMSANARARVIDLFWRRLRPGGLLLLGHSESLLHVETPFRLRTLSRGLAYEKPGGPPPRTPTPAPHRTGP